MNMRLLTFTRLVARLLFAKSWQFGLRSVGAGALATLMAGPATAQLLDGWQEPGGDSVVGSAAIAPGMPTGQPVMTQDSANLYVGPGGATSTGGTGTTTTGGTVSTEACTPGAALANARIWRLSDAQYVNAVRQLFGVLAGPHITQSEDVAEFTNLSELVPVSNPAVAAYQVAAKDIARQAVKSHFDKFMSCADITCAQQFVRNRVARAFGRRLDEQEVAGYLALYQEGLKESPQTGVRLMIEATLQSPSFLYRTELGTPTPGGPTSQVTLTPHEIATSLAFSLTNSVPDEPLWQKAETGAIANPEVFAAEVDRLLELPETKANLTQLAGYWLGLEKLKLTDFERYINVHTSNAPQTKAELWKAVGK